MSLYDRLDRDMVDARKRRAELELATLGLLKSEVVRASKEPGAGTADDALVTRVIRREVKRREEAAQAFASGGREASAQRELAEAEVLRAYLPPELSDQDLEREVRAAIDEAKPRSPKDFGAVMKAASARLGGRVEGGRIAATARRLLGS